MLDINKIKFDHVSFGDQFRTLNVPLLVIYKGEWFKLITMLNSVIYKRGWFKVNYHVKLLGGKVKTELKLFSYCDRAFCSL